MSFKELLKRVENSQEFKEFKKKYKNAKLYSGFFSLRYAFGTFVTECEQIDYLIDKRNIITFFAEENKIKKKRDILEKPVENFKTLEKKIGVDIEEIKEIIKKEIERQKIFSEIQQVIAILQLHEKKQIWNVMVLFSDLCMLRIHLDMNGNILLSKKENMMDLMRFKSV